MYLGHVDWGVHVHASRPPVVWGQRVFNGSAYTAMFQLRTPRSLRILNSKLAF